MCVVIGYGRSRCGYMNVVVGFRTGRKGSLEIDGFSFVEGESGGVLRMLNTRGNMYIGKSHTLTIHGNKSHLFESHSSEFPSTHGGHISYLLLRESQAYPI